MLYHLDVDEERFPGKRLQTGGQIQLAVLEDFDFLGFVEDDDAEFVALERFTDRLVRYDIVPIALVQVELDLRQLGFVQFVADLCDEIGDSATVARQERYEFG